MQETLTRLTFPLSTTSAPCSEEEFVARFNQRPGKEARMGYDCPLCRNKEFVLRVENGFHRSYACRCVTIRQNLTRLRNRGLLELYERCTFQNYHVTEEWQRGARDCALTFQKSLLDGWFFISGPSGCGKTHLCTAIASQLILSGHDVQIHRWVEWAAQAKSAITDAGAYAALVQPLKDCEVLYLDDFLKVQHGTRPTAADIRLAFEVLDTRYNAPDKPVLLSSELSLRQIAALDEALAGRIAERSRNHAVQIGSSPGRNYRFK